MKRIVLFTAVLLALCFLLTTLPALGQGRITGPIVQREIKHDVSPPLRDLVTFESPLPKNKFGLLNPVRIVPVAPGSQAVGRDPLASEFLHPDVSTTNLLNFDGVGASCCVPPDTNGSVGSTQFVETTNLNYAVYDKTTGAVVLGPKGMSTIWTGFGGSCATSNQSDPIVLWDKAAQRWFISIVAFNSSFNQFLQCFAVSTSADATGSYNRYSFSFGTDLNDFPKFGVWPDAYYGSYDIFRNASTYTGTEACAYDRAAMLAGGTATQVCFKQTVNDFALLPSDLDGNTAPPAGEPNLYVEHRDTSHINLFKFHVDFVTPTNSTFTGPTIISVTPWTQICPSGTRACIPQPSPGEKVDSLGDRLNYRNAYRNFGDHEVLVLSHTVDKGGSVAGARWYEIRNPNGTPTIFQSGTVTAGPNLWMPSIAMDKNQDIAVGFNASSSSVKPSVIYTGRVPGDPLGKMEAPSKPKLGTGVQTGGGNRWGDYASMSVDPADDCTFWSSQEYTATNGSLWKTRIVKFKFNSCN
jgi:hypothetical protein